MRTIDAVAKILSKEGVEFLSVFPTTPIIDAVAKIGIQPIICRQERVGVGIADGYTRVKNGTSTGVFAMQHGPGAENAFAGIATAFTDATPILLLPLGYSRELEGVSPHFSSVRSFASVTKSVEQLKTPENVADTFRRAFSKIRMGRPGPVMVEIPDDVALENVDQAIVEKYKPVQVTKTQADPKDILKASEALLKAKNPIIMAGKGVLYANATPNLIELSELLKIPVATTMGGKSAFPENHPLSLGSASSVMNGPVYEFLVESDLILALGTSLTKHAMTSNIPPGKVLIHSTNDPIDIGKSYHVDYPIIGDSGLVLHQFIDACKDLLNGKLGNLNQDIPEKIVSSRKKWLNQWSHKLTSEQIPITPYRVIGDFINNIDPNNTIVTHDSGSPRDQIMPFYKSGGPRTYIGWGKSHALGTGLGLIIGAKIAEPNKLAVNFMGDAAFGMTGLDFETAVRSNIPILTIVLNNHTMAIEIKQMEKSHELYNSRSLGGNYSEMAKSMGGWAERVTNPSEIIPSIIRAKKATENGEAALLEFITSEEQEASYKRAI